MAVSNPATLESVYTEFGAAQGTGLSAFLRGGTYVPNGSSANAGVPTALPINLSQLAGAVKYVNVSATVTPTSESGSGSHTQLPGIPITTGTATVNPSGGSGSYTYTWTRLSGDTATAINTGSGGKLAQWSKNSGGVGTYTSSWQCTVSDGTTSANVTVSVSIQIT